MVDNGQRADRKARVRDISAQGTRAARGRGGYQYGFTLMELLLYLLLFSLLLSLLLPVLITLLIPLPQLTELRLEQEGSLFYDYLQKEANQADRFLIKLRSGYNLVELYTQSNMLEYLQNGRVIQRTLNREGNLIVLQFVKQNTSNEKYYRLSRINDQLLQVTIELEKDGVQYEQMFLIGLKIDAE